MLRLCEEEKEEGVERHLLLLLLLHTKHKKFDSCFSFHPTHLKNPPPNGNKLILVNHSLHSTYAFDTQGKLFWQKKQRWTHSWWKHSDINNTRLYTFAHAATARFFPKRCHAGSCRKTTSRSKQYINTIMIVLLYKHIK